MTTLVNTFKSPFFKSSTILLALVALALTACTDKRVKAPTRRENTYVPGVSGPQEVADVTFKGQQTSVLSMTVQGNSLFLTGYPFGFSRWDIGAEPENPQLLGAASDRIDMFSPDPPFGGWTVNYFGMGGLAVMGSFAYSSGLAGMSVINIGQSAFPVEAERYPRPTAQGDQPQDVAFVYETIVPHPGGQPILYGFSKSDRVYTLAVSGQNAQVVSHMPYSSSGSVCCATGAAAFGGRIFVAMRSFLWSLTPSGNTLQSTATITQLNPVNVVSTTRFMYVHHRPTSGGFSGLQAGIYVYDRAGQNVNFLPMDPLTFAVHPNDTHIYANMDDLSVRIFRVQ